MSRGIGGLIAKVVVAALVIGGVATVAVVMKQNADRDSKPKPTTVIDAKSGTTWEMYGEPTLKETTAKLAEGSADSFATPVRIYTVDHGDWVERVQVFDSAPGEIDFTQAALTTFDAKPDTELDDLEYVKIGGFDAGTGSAPGTITIDGAEVNATTNVFATQMHAFLVTGGVAQKVGADEIDTATQEQTLRDSMHPA